MSGTLQVGGVTLGTHNSGTGKVDLTNAGTLSLGSAASNALTLGTSTTFPAGHVVQVQTFGEYPATVGNSDTSNGTLTSSTSASLITLASASNKVIVNVEFCCYTASGTMGGKVWIMEYDTSGSASGTAPVVTGASTTIEARASNLSPASANYYITGPSHNYWTSYRQAIDSSPASTTPRYGLVIQTVTNSNAFTLAATSTFGLQVTWCLSEIQA